MTKRMKTDNYIELQDLWKTSYPAVRFDNSSHSSTFNTSQVNSSIRHRPTPLPDLTATIKSPTLPFFPTSPLPSLKSPFLPQHTRNSKTRHLIFTKQKTSAVFHRVSNTFQIQIHAKKPRLTLLRKIMNSQAQRKEKKEEAKRQAKEEFHRNWDSMTEEEQAAYTKEREEARLRERKRLEDVKNGSNESRKADAKSAALTGAIVVCM